MASGGVKPPLRDYRSRVLFVELTGRESGPLLRKDTQLNGDFGENRTLICRLEGDGPLH